MAKIYQIKPSSKVPNAGTFGMMIRVGMPVPADMANDICITTPGSYEFLPLNRNVLRSALLNDPEVTKAILGLDVKDALAEKPKRQQAKKEG